MRKRVYRAIVLLSLAAVLAGMAACAENKSIANWHPVEVTAPVLCSQCHTDSRSALDHLSNFIERHKFQASQQKNACIVCHKESFCADCHAHKEEIKPSDKYKDAPNRALPHRGDYLTQHKIDGKINPAPCFRCHGRNNNRRCIACHR